jgi:beta-lactam-binding protein with PASTA domain
VAIPDVIGLTSEQATGELESDGFRVVLVHSDGADRIYKYSPSGKAAPGTVITIWC